VFLKVPFHFLRHRRTQIYVMLTGRPSAHGAAGTSGVRYKDCGWFPTGQAVDACWQPHCAAAVGMAASIVTCHRFHISIA